MPHIISLINLWCTKNLVDSQFLLGKLLSNNPSAPSGHLPWQGGKTAEILYHADPYDPAVQLVLLNTCGFISSGREEMFHTLERLLAHGKKVCLIGCAVQYFEKLLNAPSSITPSLRSPPYQGDKTMENPIFWTPDRGCPDNGRDGGYVQEHKKRQALLTNPNISLLSRNDLKNASIPQLLEGFQSQTFHDFERLESPRALTNIDHKYEYLKIAEGCNNSCSFCIIPKIRGKQTSLPISNILHEVQNLVHQGAEEIILIAQDSTRYGTDLYGKAQLFELLEQIEQLPWDFRYRVLYLSPDLLTLQQLKKLTSFRKFIPYFDIPLQHSASSVLQRMGRFYDEKAIHDLLQFIKKEFPVHFIRTNFIVGFPGETEEEFQHLHSFIQQDYFDNIALFEYHDEPLAASSRLPDQISSHIIRQRFLPLRRVVNNLLLQKQEARKGKTYTGYVQTGGQERITVRPILHCPEIDEVDEITLEQIIRSEDEEIVVWTKIQYVC